MDLDNANSYSSQGLPALDYLLNGVAASDNDIITKYTANNKYKNYLSAVVAKMISNTKLVVDDWSTYKASFESSTANTSTSSANKLINDFIYYYEKGFRANKVGIPAGIFLVLLSQVMLRHFTKKMFPRLFFSKPWKV